MSTSLIWAKLKPPVPRRHYIRRTKLESRLERLTDYKVTVIKGAPGSGKSTLMAAYVQERPEIQVRWISLDSDDNDLRGLWSYVLAALRPDLGPRSDDLRELLDSGMQADTVHTAFIELVNGLQPENDVLLVLDDAHHLQDVRIIESLQFFLRYSSERVHLVMLTRDEAPLYLGEWRMAGQLLEIDNDDLKVNATEARRFLTDTLNLQLDGTVEERIVGLAEGWIGGLQLLGIALRGKGDRIQTIPSLGRPVIEYLSGEILDALTGDERQFLIATSILAYFNDAACRRVTENDDAGALLRSFVNRDLFVAAVDESRGTYRYHPLFREFLQQHFGKLPREEAQTFHRRAARFFRDEGDEEGSVYHFLKAEQFDDALDVIRGIRGSVRRWRLLQRLPLSALEGHTDVVFQRLFSHVADQQMERCAEVIDHFRGRFEEDTANALFELFAVVFDERSFALEGSSALHFFGDGSLPARMVQLALDDETKAILYSFLAMMLTLRDMERAALDCLDEAEKLLERVDNPYIRFYCMELKSQVKEHMGDLAEGEALYGHMFRLVEEHSFLKPVVGTAQIGIVGILLKGGKLAEAETYLTKVKERAFHPLSMEIACLYNELELRLLQGDREGARAVATELKQRDVLRSPMYRAPVLRYLLLLDMADEAEVAGFRYEHIDTPHWHDDLLHARLLAREDRGEEALAFIDERLGRLRQQQAKLPLVETLLVKTHILVGDGSVPLPEDGEQSARNALREAIHYSYENRLFAPFLLMAGPEQDMVRALRHDAGAEFNTAEHQFLDELTSRWEPDGADALSPDGALGLSEREREVLHVLAEGRTNKQIAERLYISVATVKTHIVNIYSKLHVSNRVEAVAEARRRGIVDSK